MPKLLAGESRRLSSLIQKPRRGLAQGARMLGEALPQLVMAFVRPGRTRAVCRGAQCVENRVANVAWLRCGFLQALPSVVDHSCGPPLRGLLAAARGAIVPPARSGFRTAVRSARS